MSVPLEDQLLVYGDVVDGPGGGMEVTISDAGILPPAGTYGGTIVVDGWSAMPATIVVTPSERSCDRLELRVQLKGAIWCGSPSRTRILFETVEVTV